jgi:F0F1-type ATP synthase epsilon subunit
MRLAVTEPAEDTDRVSPQSDERMLLAVKRGVSLAKKNALAVLAARAAEIRKTSPTPASTAKTRRKGWPSQAQRERDREAAYQRLVAFHENLPPKR